MKGTFQSFIILFYNLFVKRRSVQITFDVVKYILEYFFCEIHYHRRVHIISVHQNIDSPFQSRVLFCSNCQAVR